MYQNSANFEITETNNSSKCLSEVGRDDLNVRTLTGRGNLEHVQKCTRGVQKSMKLSVRTF